MKCGQLAPQKLLSSSISQSHYLPNMVGKDGGKAKPLKQPKSKAKDLDEDDKAFQLKKKEEMAQLKAAKEAAGQKGGFAKNKVSGKK